MTAPTTLFRPYDKLVRISLLGREVEVPENNPLLRCLQYLAPEGVSYGRFCWNEDCQYCRVTYDLGEGTPTRAGPGLQSFGGGRHASERSHHRDQVLPAGNEPLAFGTVRAGVPTCPQWRRNHTI